MVAKKLKTFFSVAFIRKADDQSLNVIDLCVCISNNKHTKSSNERQNKTYKINSNNNKSKSICGINTKIFVNVFTIFLYFGMSHLIVTAVNEITSKQKPKCVK